MAKIEIDDISGAVRAAFIAGRVGGSSSMYDTISKAATYAIRDAAALLKARGRADIAAGGFGKKWQSAWQTKAYPENRYSLKAAAFGVQKISYASVFETGATIAPLRQRMLWVPLKGTPNVGRQKATPAAMKAQGIKLFQVRRRGKRPLLATKVRVSSKFAIGGRITMSRLRRGVEGKRGQVITLPLFVGASSVTLRPRFNLAKVARGVRDELPALYDKHMAGVE